MVLLFSFSALIPRSETKSSPERFLKIAKWKLSVNWQASGNFADTMAGQGVTLNVVSSVGVSGRGEYLLVKRPDDGPYEWGTDEGDNPNVSVSYDGRKTLTISGATGTFRDVWSYESEKLKGGSGKLEINPKTGSFDVYAVIYFVRKDIAPPSGSKPELNNVSISMTPRDSEYRKKNMLPDSGFNLSGSHEFLAMLQPFEVDPQFTKKIPLEAPWAQMKVNWTLTPAGEEDVEAVIETPKGYKEWKPAAEKTEDKAGPFPMIVNARLHKKGEKDKPANRRARFRFELVETTKEKGVCLNWPANNPQDTYDLRIEQNNNKDLEVKDGKEGQKAETKKNSSGASVVISCFDWGAFTRLKVTAILDDEYGSEVVAYLDSDKSKHELRIPKDDDENYIADCWEKDKIYGKKAETDDESSSEGDREPGDGLTLYEEYRGFMENKVHRWGDPEKKDFFIRIDKKVGQKVKPGIKLFENLAKLKVFSELTKEELSESREINRNHSHMAHVVDQHGVIIVEGDDGLVSEAVPEHRKPGEPVKKEEIIGTPKSHKEVKIAKGMLADYIDPARLSRTVAHELLHCCNVPHHGDTDRWCRLIKPGEDSSGNKVIFVFKLGPDDIPVGKGEEIDLIDELTGKPISVGKDGRIAYIGCKRGEHSGNVDCVMRYAVAKIYINKVSQYVSFSDDEVKGMGICETEEGTGVNLPDRPPEPRYGPATKDRGGCLKKICVNDKYH